MDSNSYCVKENKTGKVLLVGNGSNGLYHIRAAPKVSEKLAEREREG